jgi:hypothetical protein
MSSSAPKPQALPFKLPNPAATTRTASNHCELLEIHKLRILIAATRIVRNAGVSNMLLGGTLSLGATLAITPTPETIQATSTEAGSTLGITLTIDTDFLFPASKLVIDKQGESHYDLAGTPMSLINVLDSKSPGTETVAQLP